MLPLLSPQSGTCCCTACEERRNKTTTFTPLSLPLPRPLRRSRQGERPQQSAERVVTPASAGGKHGAAGCPPPLPAPCPPPREARRAPSSELSATLPVHHAVVDIHTVGVAWRGGQGCPAGGKGFYGRSVAAPYPASTAQTKIGKTVLLIYKNLLGSDLSYTRFLVGISTQTFSGKKYHLGDKE